LDEKIAFLKVSNSANNYSTSLKNHLLEYVVSHAWNPDNYSLYLVCINDKDKIINCPLIQENNGTEVNVHIKMVVEIALRNKTKQNGLL